jgi:shikimate 5-dehydrogenase
MSQTNKYKVNYKGLELDVYDVLKAFEVSNPAIQHAIKKLLKGGKRGYKDVSQDYKEAIQSINRAIELDSL